jgi:hypothetical protein
MSAGSYYYRRYEITKANRVRLHNPADENSLVFGLVLSLQFGLGLDFVSGLVLSLQFGAGGGSFYVFETAGSLGWRYHGDGVVPVFLGNGIDQGGVEFA